MVEAEGQLEANGTPELACHCRLWWRGQVGDVGAPPLRAVGRGGPCPEAAATPPGGDCGGCGSHDHSCCMREGAWMTAAGGAENWQIGL